MRSISLNSSNYNTARRKRNSVSNSSKNVSRKSNVKMVKNSSRNNISSNTFAMPKTRKQVRAKGSNIKGNKQFRGRVYQNPYSQNNLFSDTLPLERESVFSVNTIVCLLLIIVICVIPILWQTYRINQADINISKLEEQVKDAQMANDSLEAKLLTKQNLQKVEQIATKQYGMVKTKTSDCVAINLKTNEDNKPLVVQSASTTTNTGNNSIVKRIFGGLVKN